jgi:head-tail adaptor
MPSSGEMRHRVTIHAPEGTYGTGSPAAAVNIATGVAAKIGDLPNQFQQAERIASGGQRGYSVAQIELRYRTDVQMDFEIREECCNQRRFQIVQMTQDDKPEWLILTCHRSI